MTKKLENIFKISRELLITTLLVFFYDFILEWSYFSYVSVSFEHWGFTFTPSIIKYIEAKFWLVLLIGILYYLYQKSSFIFSIFVLLMLLFFVPASITFSLADLGRAPFYSVIFLLITVALISPHKLVFTQISLQKKYKYLLILLLLIVLLIPVVLNFGLYIDVKNLFLKNVYATREFYSANSTKKIDYIFNWLVKAIIPIALIYFISVRKYLLASFSFLLLMYLFLISGNKTIYLTCFVMLVFYFFGRNYVDKANKLLTYFVLALLFFPLLDSLFFSEMVLQGAFIMRMLFLPSLLNYCYFDFFANAPLHYAESNFFNLFFHSPYDLKAGYLISQKYFHTLDMYANNGIVSDGFMNLGYTGVAIHSIIVALVFLFFNSVKLDSKYFGYFVVLVFLFLSSPMFSMFVTSGLFIVMVLSMFIQTKTASGNGI